MRLNIKNPETDRLVRELAQLTGESLTEAVTVALSERLERVKREDLAARKARVMALAADAASRIKEPYKSMTQKELFDQLYDERGLPK